MVLAMVKCGRLVRKSSAQRRPRVSKIKAKDCPVATPVGNNRGSQTGRPEGRIKDHSHDNLLKETSNGQKANVQGKACIYEKKERRLLFAPILNCGGDVVVDEGVDE